MTFNRHFYVFKAPLSFASIERGVTGCIMTVIAGLST